MFGRGVAEIVKAELLNLAKLLSVVTKSGVPNCVPNYATKTGEVSTL